MKMFSKTGGIIIAVSILLVGFFVFRSIQRTRKSTKGTLLINNNSASISVSPTTIDFGDIPQKEGTVSQEVTVMNVGSASIEINRVSTSCGCTTATMDTSPMEPQEKRILTVRFDPMVHPDQSGPITRVVYLQTSDTEHPETEISIKGNVIPSK